MAGGLSGPVEWLSLATDSQRFGGSVEVVVLPPWSGLARPGREQKRTSQTRTQSINFRWAGLAAALVKSTPVPYENWISGGIHNCAIFSCRNIRNSEALTSYLEIQAEVKKNRKKKIRKSFSILYCIDWISIAHSALQLLAAAASIRQCQYRPVIMDYSTLQLYRVWSSLRE